MINVDEYIGKLEILKKWIALKVSDRVSFENQMDLFRETFMLTDVRWAVKNTTFEEYYKQNQQ